MKVVVTQFMSLDGVVQAPGGPEEDTDGGFAHGGWSMPYFDPEVMGGAWAAAIEGADALLLGRPRSDSCASATAALCSSWAVHRWPPGSASTISSTSTC